MYENMLVQRCPCPYNLHNIIHCNQSPLRATPDNRHLWLQAGANIVTVCCTRVDCQVHSASIAKIQKVLRPESCAKTIHSGWLGLGETTQENPRKQQKHSQPWHGSYIPCPCLQWPRPHCCQSLFSSRWTDSSKSTSSHSILQEGKQLNDKIIAVPANSLSSSYRKLASSRRKITFLPQLFQPLGSITSYPGEGSPVW